MEIAILDGIEKLKVKIILIYFFTFQEDTTIDSIIEFIEYTYQDFPHLDSPYLKLDNDLRDLELTIGRTVSWNNIKL
jgi:hypothetical protein